MPISKRIKVRRGARRAVYDQETIHRILDNNLVCQVGFTVDGEARIIPTAYLRIDEAIYLHGNRRNLMLNSLLDGQTACVSVMQLDGLVLARSGFHHSVNYQSVTLFGQASVVQDDVVSVLDQLIDKMVPGRSQALRPHTRKELNATLVIRIPIDEASAKVRMGHPIDDDDDYDLPIWAGVLPIRATAGALIPDPLMKPSIPLPEHLKQDFRVR